MAVKADIKHQFGHFFHLSCMCFFTSIFRFPYMMPLPIFIITNFVLLMACNFEQFTTVSIHFFVQMKRHIFYRYGQIVPKILIRRNRSIFIFVILVSPVIIKNINCSNLFICNVILHFYTL